MQLFLTVTFWFLMGGVCAHYAKARGRSSRHWFFIGMLFGIFGLIALFILPKLAKTAEPKPVEPTPAIPQKLWYYLDAEHKPCGPISTQAFESAKLDGKITSETFVWNEELPDWKPLSDLTS